MSSVLEKHACVQMYAAHPLFADEMKAIVAMSTFLSTTGVIGRFVSIVFDALVHTGSESAVLKFWDKVIDWFLCLFSPTFQAMRVLSGEMTRSHDTTGINDWSFKNGDSAAVLWLLVQLVLNMAILLITTSGVVADMMHIAEQAIGKYLPSLNPSLKVLEDSEEPPVREESGEISRGPSRPVLFSQVRNHCVIFTQHDNDSCCSYIRYRASTKYWPSVSSFPGLVHAFVGAVGIGSILSLAHI